MGELNKDQVANPGAGTYDPTQRQARPKTPTWKVGTAKRRPLSAILPNPGPGMYD